MLEFLFYLWFWKSIHISYFLLRVFLATLQINWQLIDKNGRFHHFLKSNKRRTFAEIEKDEKNKGWGAQRAWIWEVKTSGSDSKFNKLDWLPETHGKWIQCKSG